MGFDLVIRDGTVVTPGHRETADIGVRDGRIAEIGGTLAGPEELDAGGLLVLPGGIDAHVHLVYAALAAELGQTSRSGWTTSGPGRWPRSPAASPRREHDVRAARRDR